MQNVGRQKGDRHLELQSLPCPQPAKQDTGNDLRHGRVGLQQLKFRTCEFIGEMHL